jgi:hypothetical protein
LFTDYVYITGLWSKVLRWSGSLAKLFCKWGHVCKLNNGCYLKIIPD